MVLLALFVLSACAPTAPVGQTEKGASGFFDDIGKTLGEIKNEHPEGEFVVNLSGFPDCAAACFGETGAEYMYFFFGGHDGDFEKAMNECEDQIRCAGFVTTANVLFVDMGDNMSFQDFFALIGVEEYDYFGEDVMPAEGWLRFMYNGMEVMMNTNQAVAGGGWIVTGEERIRSDAPVSVVDLAILNSNNDLADEIMFP